MTRLPPPEATTAPHSPFRARALRAQALRVSGMSDKAIAAQMMAELPFGSKLVITSDDVWRSIRRLERETGER